MQKYIGCKVIEAEPCKAWKDMGEHKIGEEGYKVTYPDGYVSWSPKEVFEASYVVIPSNITLSQKMCKKVMESFVGMLMLDNAIH